MNTFYVFKEDVRKAAVLEVIEMKKRELTIFCNCYRSKTANACKGDMWIHVWAKLIRQEILPRPVELEEKVLLNFFLIQMEDDLPFVNGRRRQFFKMEDLLNMLVIVGRPQVFQILSNG